MLHEGSASKPGCICTTVIHLSLLTPLAEVHCPSTLLFPPISPLPLPSTLQHILIVRKTGASPDLAALRASKNVFQAT